MLLKLLEPLQMMIYNLGGTFKIKEMGSIIKKSENDIVGASDLMPFHFKVNEDEFSALLTFNKLQTFNSTLIALVCLTNFNDYDGDLKKGFLNFFENYSQIRILLDFCVSIKNKINENEDFDNVMIVLDEIFMYGIQNFENQFDNLYSQNREDKFIIYEESMKIIEDYFNAYYDNRGNHYIDPEPLLEIIIAILGDIDPKNNKEITEKSDIIVNKIMKLMSEITDKYFTDITDITYKYFTHITDITDIM